MYINLFTKRCQNCRLPFATCHANPCQQEFEKYYHNAAVLDIIHPFDDFHLADVICNLHACLFEDCLDHHE